MPKEGLADHGLFTKAHQAPSLLIACKSSRYDVYGSGDSRQSDAEAMNESTNARMCGICMDLRWYRQDGQESELCGVCD